MRVSDGVWLSQSTVSKAEEAFFCTQYGTEASAGNEKRHKSPGSSSGHVHFQKSKLNNERARKSKSPHEKKVNSVSRLFDKKESH